MNEFTLRTTYTVNEVNDDTIDHYPVSFSNAISMAKEEFQWEKTVDVTLIYKGISHTFKDVSDVVKFKERWENYEIEAE